MNHNEAKELQAAAKYVLGELSQVQRDEYEDHYIDCPECAKEVYVTAAFADTTREVFQQEKQAEAAKAADRVRAGWFAWLKPIVAVPAFAVLLLALSYQTVVSVPHWKNQAMQAAASGVMPMHSLIQSNVRGSELPTFRVKRNEIFGVYVDVPVDRAYSFYVLRLEDAAGHSTTLSTISYAEAQKTVVAKVNPWEQSGVYQIVVFGLTSQDADPAKATTLATMKFNVEFAS
jgi:hypothetical protein